MQAAQSLVHDLVDARRRTLDLVDALDDDRLRGAPHPLVNPLLWELGHVGWFQEYWCARHLRSDETLHPGADDLWDSSNVVHATRWELPLPGRVETLGYLAAVLDRVIDRLVARPFDERAAYVHRLALGHEDMHDEAFAMTLQIRGWPAPRAWRDPPRPRAAGACPGFVPVPGGRYAVGAERSEPFVFDNEKWEHEVEVAPFEIARAPVTHREYAAFVADGGYERSEPWSPDGARWRERSGARAPLYWSRADGAWTRRRFDREEPLPPDEPVCHVSFFEAEAYARWAGARLPTEVEWEVAASRDPSSAARRRLPWGDAPPTLARANLDGDFGGPIDVGALSDGDSASGCRQLLGNVWEWTASEFLPYPGFAVDPYADYSRPWFGTHRVLRGGSWVTRARLLRNTWRNFYTPNRRDPFVGFRLARSIET